MVRAETLFGELHRAGPLVENTWKTRQNDRLDRLTRFVYRCQTAADLHAESTVARLSEDESSYAIHRWRNFRRHEAWMQLLVERVVGIQRSSDRFSKTQDFTLLMGGRPVPFDLKVTRYPLSMDADKGDRDLAEWFYRNQSRQQRFHRANRLFVVGVPEQALYDFSLACRTVDAFDANVPAHCHRLSFEDGMAAIGIILKQAKRQAA